MNDIQPCADCGQQTLVPADPQSPRSTDVIDLLSHNGLPSSAQRVALQAVVDRTPGLLAELDQKLTLAESALERLRRERELVASHLQDAKTILHPVRYVPDDVLHEIFLLSRTIWAPFNTNVGPSCSATKDSKLSIDPRYEPWNLSHVCKNWRNVAINSPKLWSFLNLDFTRTHLSPRALMFKLNLFLERGGEYDLSVVIVSDNISLVDHPAMASLELSTRRWKHLKVQSSATSLQSLSGALFPRLEDVRARLIDHAFPVDTFAHAHNLRYLGCGNSATCHNLMVPYGGIRTFFTVDAAPPPTLANLRDMGQLECAVLYVRDEVVVDWPVRLSLLKKLSAHEHRNSEPGSLSRFLELLDTPSVTDLTLGFPRYDRDLVFPPISQYKNLTTLAISCIGSVQPIAQLLHSARSVQELRLACKNLDSLLFDELAIRRWETDDPVPLPHLRILDLRHSNITGSTLRLLNMLESRTLTDQERAGPPSQSGIDEDMDVDHRSDRELEPFSQMLGIWDDPEFVLPEFTPLEVVCIPPGFLAKLGPETSSFWQEISLNFEAH